ncbi:MAG: PEP-CTERM sorting domain-containing protein [Akkermansiaceae bacterium]
MRNTILTTALGGILTTSAHATVLATPNFDTDSYIFFGTNNEFNPQITLGESQQGTPSHPHFNFGVMTFDVTTLNTSGDKFLSLSAVEYATLTPNPNGPPTTTYSSTGNGTIQLVALGESFADFQASSDKTAWYDTYVQSGSVPVVGTFSFTNESTRYVNVTSVVNGWINDGSTNNGFALFASSGEVELASSTYTANELLRPALVDAVPEPSAVVLTGLGSLLLLLHRQRA